MTKAQAAAYVFAQAVSALSRIEGMKAENAIRASKGSTIAYDDAAFDRIESDYVISHNSVIKIFNEAYDE